MGAERSGLIECRVERLDGAGAGVALDAEGSRRIVPGALPGERVAAAFSESGAALERVLEPSPQRVRPPCPHAGSCGGCALQHAHSDLLSDWKRDRVAAALARVGVETEIDATVASPLRSRRRVKLAARRGKKGVQLGFFTAKSHLVAPIESCLVMRPEIEAALEGLKRLGAFAAPRSRTIAIWAETSESGLDVAVEEAKELDPELSQAAARWAEELDVARLTWNGETLAMRRPPLRRCGRAMVCPPPGAFVQATAEGEAALVSRAVAALSGARKVADLFAGAGTFALALAERSEVLAVEGDEALVAALERGWRETGGALKSVRAVRRDLFRRPLLAEELRGLEGAVFDPPRAGAEAQAAALAEAPAGLSRLVGVSCNPASFARDAAILSRGGWRLTRATPIDQFLFTPHVELIGVFER